jgi:hypothetical protein
MRLHLVLAATLAAFFVVGCSTEKSTSPKAGASVEPQDKPVQPSHEAVSAPPPKADPPPAATASLPTKNQDPAKDNPPAPPDPWAGISVERRHYYEQVADLLVPVVKAGGAAAQAAFQPWLSENERRMIAVVQLGEYKGPLNWEAETTLRALLAKTKDTESETESYLAAVDSLLAGPKKGRLPATAYEDAIDGGADFPATTREAVAALTRENPILEAFAQGYKELQDAKGALGQETEYLRPKLLGQSVQGNDLFELARLINQLGQSVIKKRQQTQTFHGLVATLPDPYRTNVLMELAWSPNQQSVYEEKRGVKSLSVSVDEKPQVFLAFELARRDAIGGCYHNVDARGWQALDALDSLLAEFQAVVDKILRDHTYQFRPLIPADAPRDDASNVLSIIPLRGSAMDHVPTLSAEGKLIEPDVPHTYADIVRPGNILVGSCTDSGMTYYAELYLRAIKDKMVRGELVVGNSTELKKFLFRGEVSPTAFSIEVPWDREFRPHDTRTFTGSLDEKGMLTGKLLRGTEPEPLGSFSFSLRK